MRDYTNPYVAGVGLGLVLLACFVVAGQGLGASGAFAEAASAAVTTRNAYFDSYRQDGVGWIVWEVAGIVVGAAVSALMAGRFKWQVARGPVGVGSRLGAALAGGVVMGVGAVLARGCTSGQALTGGALLSVGSWAFMIAVFVAGFAVAPLLRRLWS
ncbi:hypothetical protein ABAC460_22790 [Asticcacaulis sp. AC460]|uniref:YeeE/YedE thiosulfate transporter family protein n=1 Tax=Asticcacaulis sp. AC460 TaxID=1282360 RepID=UPI0003C3DFB3|nr:YeeE/YedE thiosulfate transporter family protein [Asticcacaulis sp. AC460]ESQ86658.1 hypothetical protein ABAC460_22790 [Asticcacaulis sp. AC460]